MVEIINMTRMNLKNPLLLFLIFLCSANVFSQKIDSSKSLWLSELDEFWKEVSRTVSDGDFEAYAATYHEKAILVSGISDEAYPIADALARWKKGFDDTRAGLGKSSVEFRFSKRIGDGRAAHETGIFHYSYEIGGERNSVYINFEALLIKENGWKMMMEYQKSRATKEEWDLLK